MLPWTVLRGICLVPALLPTLLAAATRNLSLPMRAVAAAVLILGNCLLPLPSLAPPVASRTVRSPWLPEVRFLLASLALCADALLERAVSVNPLLLVFAAVSGSNGTLPRSPTAGGVEASGPVLPTVSCSGATSTGNGCRQGT